ncbi:MAG TPA: molybdate ABC transporter substrate-binding protein [Nitrospira sp.]|nr:molybdate ABC transporter substrate-binding protein [Nitrospira sp.]
MATIRRCLVVIAVVGEVTAFLVSGNAVHAEPLIIGAPPSLRPAFHDILPMFEQESGAAVEVVYSPSKTLARDIEHGTPIDVFLAAGGGEVEALHKKGLTLNRKARIYAQTSIVLVMSANSPSSLVSFHQALENSAVRIAVGDPHTSSLGEVTAQSMTKLHPTSKPHSNVLYASHSEDIIDLIRAGKATVGLVYRIDTINSGQVRISDETPFGTSVRVQFEQAVVSTCRPALCPVAEQFSNFLMSPRIQKLLVKYGFES